MSFSAGVFSINSSGQPVVAGTTITDTAFNALTADLATGLSTCILKDGTQTATAVVPFAYGIDISAATGGTIKFPATQVPSANVNTLDDYEEGTFTPAMTFGGAAVGMTFSKQSGFYTKIGNMVMANLVLQLSAKGSSTGTVLVTGLPFTSNSATNNDTPAALRLANVNTSPVQALAFNSANSTTVQFEDLNVGSINDTYFTATTYIAISIAYRV